MSSRYMKSECRAGFLHKFKIIKETGQGVLERCERCGLAIHFPSNASNLFYLQYHVRSALQRNDPRFIKEYGNI